MASTTAPKPPISRKVIVGALAAGLGALLPLLHVYTVPVFVQGFISTAEYSIASYAVKEETNYLKIALAYLQSIGK